MARGLTVVCLSVSRNANLARPVQSSGTAVEVECGGGGVSLQLLSCQLVRNTQHRAERLTINIRRGVTCASRARHETSDCNLIPAKSSLMMFNVCLLPTNIHKLYLQLH